MKPSRDVSKLIASLTPCWCLSGCAQMSGRQNNAMTTGAVIGTLVGAGAGAGIAAANTHGALTRGDAAAIGILAGALVGAVIGAALGYVIGTDSKQTPTP